MSVRNVRRITPVVLSPEDVLVGLARVWEPVAQNRVMTHECPLHEGKVPMKRWFGAGCGAMLGLVVVGGQAHAAPSGIAYASRSVRGIRTDVVTLDLNNPAVQVSVELAKGGLGRSELFKQAVVRTGATVAATGTYFDPKTLRPVGDLVIDGQFVHRGFIGTSLAFREGDTSVVEVRDRARGGKYPGYDTVLTAGPRILAEGKWIANPRQEGFKDPALLGRRRRLGAGVTSLGKLLLIHPSRSVTLGELGKIASDLGAVDAINLDGGTSTALYYRGRVLAQPGRSLTNLLVAYERPVRKAQPKPSVVVAAATPARAAGWLEFVKEARQRVAARAETESIRAGKKKRKVVRLPRNGMPGTLRMWDREQVAPAWKREEV